MSAEPSRSLDRWLAPGLGLAYALAAGFSCHARQPFEFDPDEGFNLMKVMLVRHGHALYKDVWSDQPPLFTWLGVVATSIFGETAGAVRGVSVLLASLLVFGLCDVVRRELGGLPGRVACVACVLLLPLGSRFRMLSMAAMVGLPAVAFGVLALWALIAIKRPRAAATLSGILFGLSLLTKLYTLFLLPLYLVHIARRRETAPGAPRAALHEIGLFMAGLGAVTVIGLGPLLFSGHVSQLYASHVAPGSLGLKGLVGIGDHLLPDTWLYVLALIGLVVAFWRRGPAGVFLGTWLLIGLVVVLWHRPFWFHHALLLWVPACGLSALLGGEIVARFRERVPRRLGDAALAIAGALLFVNDVAFFWVYEPSEAKKARRGEEADVEAAVRRYAPCARLMVTSRHMYAFHLGIEVPPALAVTSAKRFQSDQLTAEEVRAMVASTRPEVVILDSRWDQAIRDAVESTLPRDYALIYAGTKAFDVRAYVLRSLHCDRPST